jgi:UTP--glucose-1-phosphate uridylyltransferase
MSKVRRAIIPAAGLGTRFLPATKAIPKEMIPIVDVPMIQFIVEEAVRSGIEDVILVTARHKEAIENHFDFNYELEDMLDKRHKDELVEASRKIASMCNLITVRQKQPLGLGHAVLTAASIIGNEPCAILLGDDMIDSEIPCTKQLIDVFLKVFKTFKFTSLIGVGYIVVHCITQIFFLSVPPSIKRL